MSKNLNSICTKEKIQKILFFILLAGFLSGCGFWTNFKTYFNTYYNANRIFEDAEEKLLAQRKELFAYEEEIIPKTLSTNFDEVIEKTSAILQHNKESDYVDEALIMTGKSFYYQQNYSRALRKFNELASVPNSEFELENKLWIGKSYLKLREFTKAIRILDEVKDDAIAEEENDVLVEVYKNKIGYLIYNEEYENAASEIDEFLLTDIDDELRAEVYYELGLLHELTENFEAAEKAFIEVENYSPSFDVDYNSRFEIAKLKKELGEVDRSLELFNALKDEDKFSDNWDQIDLEIGKIFYDRNEIDEAFDTFTEVDTTYDNTESSSVARFYRAEILENYYHDYDSALVFYKSASTSKAPEELKFAAQKKSRLLNKYITFHDKLENFKLQIKYLTDPQTFIEDSLDYVEKVKLDSIKNAAAGNQVTNRSTRNRQKANPKYKKPVRPKLSIDSLHALNSKNYFELANLLFTEFDDPDSAFYYYNLSLEEKEDNPNQAQTYYSMGNYYLIKEDKKRADSMFTIVYDNFEFDPIRNEAAKHLGKPLYDFNKDPVEEEYGEAEKIYDSDKYDQAISKLYDIYEKHPKSIYASKSLYTIGYIYENDLDLPDSAASVYNVLSNKYRTSEYAKAIQIKFAGHKQEQARLKAKADSIKIANGEIEVDSLQQNDKIVKKEVPKENDDTILVGQTKSDRIIRETETKTTETKSDLKQKSPEPNSDNRDKIVKVAGVKGIEKSKEPTEVIKSRTDEESTNVTDNDSTETGEKEQVLDSEYKKDESIVVSRDIFKNNNEYFVQISSWKTEEIARNEVQKLKDKKYNAVIFKTYVEDKEAIYHRVRVGPYNSFQAAKKIRQKLNGY